MNDTPTSTRFGFAALIGAPNAGKSTLVNQLVGAKISIVSHKVQTTRARIRAIMVQDNAQVVLVDTPGIFAPRRKLDEEMVKSAWAGSAEADATALLVDARRGLDEQTEAIIRQLEANKTKALLIINKTDLVKRDLLLPLSRQLNERYAFTDTFMVSALTGSGI